MMTTDVSIPSPTTALLNEREAAAYLSLSHRTLQAWRLRGGGPAFVRLGTAIRYERDALDRYIAERARANTAG